MATHEDAKLVIELSRWAQEWGFHDANRWIRAHEDEVRSYETFIEKHPVGSGEYKQPFTVLGYFENIGLFFKHEVLDVPLLFDWLDFEGPWELLQEFALSHRASRGEPTLWENFERLAQAQRKYRTRNK